MIFVLLHIKDWNVVPICTHFLSANVLLYHDLYIVLSQAASDESYGRCDREDKFGPLNSELKVLSSFVRSAAICQSLWLNIQ
jgi:hypothetical protein